MSVAGDTIRAMDEKNIDLRDHFPKSWRHLADGALRPGDQHERGRRAGEFEVPVRTWDVPDPVMMDYKAHCRVRDRIETLVMDLILELRRERKMQQA